MKSYTNIYDIDGNIIRKAGDTHKFTVEEAQDKIKYYVEKIKELNKENEEYDLFGYNVRMSSYNQYIDNLANYIIHERMMRGDFSKPKQPENQEVINIPSEPMEVVINEDETVDLGETK
jgi:hypothetical protein